MLKRVIAVVLSLLMIFCLVSCSKNTQGSEQSNSAVQSGVQSSIESQTDGSSSTPSSSNNNSLPAGAVNGSQLGSNEVDDDVVIEDVETEDVKNTVTTQTSHNALSADKYYQYSFLSSSEKAVYKALVEAIKNADNIIDLKEYNIHKDSLGKLFSCVSIDNPQYFWLSNTYSFGYRGDDGRATYIILYYTDGTTIDNIDNKTLTVISLADRTKITAQISEFNQKVKSVIDTVSPSLSAVEKERKIHDYIIKNTTYDDKTAESYGGTGASPHPSFNAYGALCKGTAVCMGYSELFQYLCYLVGINVTQVTGEAGGSHMWSCVELEGAWYHVDVTWDDSSSNGYPIYEYFNITESQISADHIIDSLESVVPIANAVKFSFDNIFGITVSDFSKPPENYKNAMDYILSNREKYIIVNLCGNTVSNTYLGNHFISDGSTIRNYAATKGHNISLQYGYVTIGKYLYLIIEGV